MKIKTAICSEIVERIKDQDYYKIVLFGASNTERYMPSVHWGDVLQVGLRTKFGKYCHVINSGISGNNTIRALERFDRDVAAFAPDIVIITFAGNDCNPAKLVSIPDFSANLTKIVANVRALNAIPVLQTYYKINYADDKTGRAESFDCYMDAIRDVAIKHDVFLVDQYKYFDALPHDTLIYKMLLNPLHVNESGNIFMGVNLLYHLGIDPMTVPHNEKLLPAIELYKKIAE